MGYLPKPKDVHAQRGEGVVEIAWDDGHRSRYPMAYLRGHCPCAACQGHGGGHVFHSTPADVKVRHMEMVGAYAINLQFSDGHDSGIFSYEHLLKICPCEEHGGEGYNPENLAGL